MVHGPPKSEEIFQVVRLCLQIKVFYLCENKHVMCTTTFLHYFHFKINGVKTVG
jgi:hypothetical protein